jgi:tRNA (guanine10-N2)-dimethyltransferase
VRLCFELSGEHPTLPLAEAVATLALYGTKARIARDGSAATARCAKGALPRLVSRLALCHAVSECLGEHRTLREATASADRLSIEGRRVKVRATIVSGRWSKDEQAKAEKRVGAILAKRNKIDLREPEVEVRVLLGNRVRVCRLVARIDRKGYESRKGERRPFFSPISLHPKYARALVNLARVRDGGTLLDPFCGTGGILIEGALAGASVAGSDIDQRMMEGAAANMRHFGLEPGRMEACDISDIARLFGRVDAIATDPPYGKASSTWKERPRELHRRLLHALCETLADGGRAAVVLPDVSVLSELPPGMEMLESHPLRVHRSLVRNFVVMRKRIR